MEAYLPYLLPPLLGALIGYLTNYVAIRMLFRPLREWRVFGMRVPLTPGIIPSKRDELARRMGEMVGSHLLTSEDVGGALKHPGFRRELKGAIGDKLDRFLDREFGALESLIPQQFRPRFRDLVDHLLWRVTRAVFAYLDSEEFEQRLRSYLQRQGSALLSRDLSSFFDVREYENWRGHVEQRLAQLLAAPQAEREIARFIDERLDRLLASEKSLRELLPEDLLQVINQQLQQEIPPLLEKLGGMLYDPSFRQRLVGKAREGIEGFLDSLEGLSGLLAGFFNMDKLYSRLPEFLDKAGDEIACWLREEKTQQQVGSLLCERLDLLLDQPLNGYIEKLPYEKVAGVRSYVRTRLVAAATGPRAVDMTMQALEGAYDRIKDRSFEALLQQALPEGSLEQWQERLISRLLETLRSPLARDTFASVMTEKIEGWLYHAPLGKLSARLPADVREELEEGLCLQIEELLRKEVPPLIETLNVARIVEEKVNSLDLLQVEGLLMGVMQEQFKYINLFGALLGLLIGLLNLVALGLS